MSKDKDNSAVATVKPDVAPEKPADKHSTAAMMKVVASDEFAGQGGSYLYDPATGKRTRIEDE